MLPFLADGYTIELNERQARISNLYDLLNRGIKPWEWDYEYYDDPDMEGKFYPEDIADIKQLDKWTAETRQKMVNKNQPKHYKS